MRPGEYRDPARSFSTLMLIGFLGFLSLALVGSFAPFDFTPMPLDEAITRVAAALTTMPKVVSRIDFVSNVILFVPLGFLLTGYLALRQGRVPGGLIDAWMTLIASVALSTSIESFQIFFPSRNVSPGDVVGETLGGLIGAGVWLATGGLLWRIVGAGQGSRRPRALTSLLLVSYALLYAGAQWLPFDITLEPSELAAKFRAGRVVLMPFASMTAADGQWIARAAVSMLAAGPIGALLVWAAARGFRAVAVAAGLVFVAGVEAGQVLIVSRIADTTDIILAAAGLLAGAALASSLATGEARHGRVPADRRWPALVAACVWVLGVALSEWAPFDFSTDPDLLARHWGALTALPFVNYFAASEWNAFINLVQKMLLIVPLGVLLGMGLRVDQRSWGRSAGALAMLSLVLTLVEIGQVFLPSRSPDLTDVIVGTLGGGIAIVLMSWRPTTASPCHRRTSQRPYGLVC